jgi:hypothetical protein
MATYSDDVDHLMANGIGAYLHCALCLGECPPSQSPAEFARLSFGSTPYGLQVWCVRHNVNVYHLDLTTPRPRCVTHALKPAGPFSEQLNLGCPRCGFEPGVDESLA